MNPRYLPHTLLSVVLACTAVAGCSESETLEVFSCDDSICFTAPALSQTNYYVHSGGISRSDCDSDCIYWEVLTPGDDNAINYQNQGEIKYGQSFEHIQVTTPPRALKQGRYNVSFNIGYASSLNGKRGARFSATFTVDGNGNLTGS
ncbi:hypothetical protein DU002_13290 [Corallincola holothuriorum]|uniref:Lipoprotein n=1 Tax=Corallincola holothuriorum TaxID=2282215 RepID=A0A368NDU9_9GAMM|nr:hypothetical protein [Corallincola holothuriorum]RCU48762.1 hypothetical protein DU002_13290 [Corallincola holothuriorum]